jgi:hypothetical protein
MCMGLCTQFGSLRVLLVNEKGSQCSSEMLARGGDSLFYVCVLRVLFH